MCEACAPRYWHPTEAYWTLWPPAPLGSARAAALVKVGLPAHASAPPAYVLWPANGSPQRVAVRRLSDARSLAMDLPGPVRLLEQVAPPLWREIGTVRPTPPGDLMVEGFVCKAARGPDLRTAAAQLATALREHDRTLSAPALTRYLERLDVPWHTLTAAQTTALLTEARGFLAQASGAALLPAWQRTIDVAVTDLARRTKASVREAYAPSVQTSLAQPELAAVAQIGDQSGFFLRDALGRRSDDLTRRGRSIVQAGLREGLGRKDIARQLEEQLPDLWQGRGAGYATAVASVATQRARVATEIHTYREAGIEQLVITAVLDERTTIACRLMHGQILSVSGCVAHLNRVAAIENPEDIYTANPFMEIKRDQETGKRYMQTRTTGVRFAEVLRSGYGTRDDRGSGAYSKAGNQMFAANVGPPPYHFRCRTTTEPLLTTVQVPRGYVARMKNERAFGLEDPDVELFPAPTATRASVMGDTAAIDTVRLPDAAEQARTGRAALRRTAQPAVVERYGGRPDALTLYRVSRWAGTSAEALSVDPTLLRGASSHVAVVGRGDDRVILAAVLANETALARDALVRVLADGERWARLSGHDCPGWRTAAAAYRRALADPAADHPAAARAFLEAGTAGGWMRVGETAESVRFHVPPPRSP